MSRCLTSIALLLAATLLAGCAEESLDLPLEVEDSGPPVVVHDWIGETNPEFEVEPEEPSAARSIWNALLKGTAEAVDDSESQP